jgi:hypothetical protein
MAHFAEVGVDNVVLRVLVVDNKELLDDQGQELEAFGKRFLRNIFGGTWVQTSYNGNFRKRFAAIGDTYDSQRDAFIKPKPFDSWTLNEDTCNWEAPVAYPDSTRAHQWNEETQEWEELPGGPVWNEETQEWDFSPVTPE